MTGRKLIVAALLVLAIPAAAQQPEPPATALPVQPLTPDITPEARQAARELFASIGGASLLARTVDSMRAQIVQSIQRQGKPADEAGSIVDDLLLPDLKAHVGELQDMLADLYAAHYSMTELRELRAFLQSPLGQKMIRSGPQMEAEDLAVALAWGQRVARDAIAKHIDELRQRGVKL